MALEGLRCVFTPLQGPICYHLRPAFFEGGTWVSSLSPGFCRYSANVCIFLLNKCPPQGLLERIKGARGVEIHMYSAFPISESVHVCENLEAPLTLVFILTNEGQMAPPVRAELALELNSLLFLLKMELLCLPLQTDGKVQ